MRRLARTFCAAALVAAAVERCAPAAEVVLVDRPFDAAAAAAEHSARQARLRAALTAFDGGLEARGDEIRAGWREYLQWNEWAAPLLAGGAPRDAEMRRIVKRFYAAEEGLEHPQVVELAAALTSYLDNVEARRVARADVPGEYRRRVEQLQAALAAEPVDFASLEDAVWWLSAMRQAPEAVAQVRAQYSGPSIVGQVARGLVEAKLDMFEERGRETRPLRNTIQGASVVGTAIVDSHTSGVLWDAPADARVRITTQGTVHAPNNTSTSGRVRVASSSTTQFTAVAELYWTGDRFEATRPQVSAEMNSRVRSISAPPLIRRAAARRVAGSRGAAEAEGERIVEQQVAESMSARLATVVERVTAKVQNFMSFLARTGNTAVRWTTRVRPTSVQVGFLPSSPSGLGSAPHDPPPLDGEDAIGLSFHDSGVEGILARQVAGAVWRDVNFSMLQRELTGGNSEEFMIGLEPERWSVDWAWRAPLQIHFKADHAVIRFRFARVEIDGSAYDAPCEVSAKLEVSATPEGHEVRTVGGPTVVSLDDENPLPPHFLAFLERKFRGMFTPKFYLDGLQFPAGGTLDGMSGFRASGAILEPHWVHLRYTKRQPAEGETAPLVQTSAPSR